MITVNPSSPTSDDSVVFEFVVSTNGCYMPQTSVVGSHFYFEMVFSNPPQPCLGTYIPSDVNWPVGRLKAGNYQITVVQIGGNSETQAFSVAQGVLPFPTPPIPTVGVAGVALLALALLWGAHRALKRTSNRAA